MLISQFNIVLYYANKINVWILQITTWISQKKNSTTRDYLLIESQFLKMKWNNKLNPELGSTLNWKKKLPYYCCCLVGRSVDLETTFFLFFHILIFYLKLCFCSYNKALTSSFFWLLLGNQSKSEIDLRWKISALFLSYCLLFWNDLEYIPTYIYHIFFVT